jgi:hypothetical protein
MKIGDRKEKEGIHVQIQMRERGLAVLGVIDH